MTCKRASLPRGGRLYGILYHHLAGHGSWLKACGTRHRIRYVCRPIKKKKKKTIALLLLLLWLGSDSFPNILRVKVGLQSS